MFQILVDCTRTTTIPPLNVADGANAISAAVGIIIQDLLLIPLQLIYRLLLLGAFFDLFFFFFFLRVLCAVGL
jgi:hypothetical protein